jgi:hypothetical protein
MIVPPADGTCEAGVKTSVIGTDDLPTTRSDEAISKESEVTCDGLHKTESEDGLNPRIQIV